MNRHDAEKLGLKIIAIDEGEKIHQETYKNFDLYFVPCENGVHAISRDENLALFCIQEKTLSDAINKAHESIDSYWSVDWQEIDNRSKLQ